MSMPCMSYVVRCRISTNLLSCMSLWFILEPYKTVMNFILHYTDLILNNSMDFILHIKCFKSVWFQTSSMQQACSKHTESIGQACNKHAANTQQACSKHAASMQQACSKHKASMQQARSIHNTHSKQTSGTQQAYSEIALSTTIHTP